MSRRATAGTPSFDGLRFEHHRTAGAFFADGDSEQDPCWEPGRIDGESVDRLPAAAAVLSYGFGIIEGLKVHRASDGRLLVFRGRDHGERFVRSAERLLLLPYPVESFIAALARLVVANRQFVPPSQKGSFYLRPLLYGVDEMLGMRRCRRFRVAIYGSPVGELHHSDGLALDVLDTPRAPRGGTAEAKAIVNYAGTLQQRLTAQEAGFDDVLFTAEGLAQETTGTNIFCLLRSGVLVTPELDGRFLGGITRDSVIALAKRAGLSVEQRPLPVAEIGSDADEVFCTGTASGVLSVTRMRFGGRERCFERTYLARKLGEQLLAIKRGIEPDPYGWTEDLGMARADEV